MPTLNLTSTLLVGRFYFLAICTLAFSLAVAPRELHATGAAANGEADATVIEPVAATYMHALIFEEGRCYSDVKARCVGKIRVEGSRYSEYSVGIVDATGLDGWTHTSERARILSIADSGNWATTQMTNPDGTGFVLFRLTNPYADERFIGSIDEVASVQVNYH